MAGDMTDPSIVIEQNDMNEGNEEHERMRRQGIVSNFPLILCPYEDTTYLEDLSELRIVRSDEEDFKRVVHASLLSNGANACGWELHALKNAVKDAMGFKHSDDVDKFVAEHFRIKTFKEFLDREKDIAIVSEDGLIKPFLDETNRDLFEDAVASSKNRDEKLHRKDERIAASLELPENVEQFYRGVNRLRQAVLNAYEKYESNMREGALARVSAMNGTDEKVIGVNFNHVCTEYRNLYEVNLTGEETKKICGRSTLMLGLKQGKPQCLVDTIVIENKMKEDLEPGENEGAYIALKTTSREYSEAEIQAAVAACKQLHSQTRHRLNKGKGGGGGRKPEQPTSSEYTKMQRLLREQRERMAANSVTQTAPAGATSPNRTDSSGHDTMVRQVPSTSNKNGEEDYAIHVSLDDNDVERYEGESSDEQEQIYSDLEDSVERHVAANDKKKMRQKKREQSSNEESTASTSHAVLSSHNPPSKHSIYNPQPIEHPKVPYGQLPPASGVLSYDDEKERIDDLLEAAASHALARHTIASRGAPGQGVHHKNTWEEDDEPEAILQSVVELQHRQPASANRSPHAAIFTPTIIPDEAYQQGGRHLPLPLPVPPQQMHTRYEPMQQRMQQQQQFAPSSRTPMTAGMMQGPQHQPAYAQPLFPQQEQHPQRQFTHQDRSFVHAEPGFGGTSAHTQFLPPGDAQIPGYHPPPRHEYAAAQRAGPSQGQDWYQGSRPQNEHWYPSTPYGNDVYGGASTHQHEPPRHTPSPHSAFGARHVPPEMRRDEMPMRRGEPVYDERARAGLRRPPSPPRVQRSPYFPPSPPPQRQQRQPYNEPSPNEYRGFCRQNVEREERRRREARENELEKIGGGVHARAAPRQERGFGGGGEINDGYGGQQRERRRADAPIGRSPAASTHINQYREHGASSGHCSSSQSRKKTVRTGALATWATSSDEEY